MAVTTTTTATPQGVATPQPIPAFNVGRAAAHVVVAGSMEAVAGWACGRLFHFIAPAMGGLFGFSLGVTHTIAAAALDRLFGSSQVEKVAKFILSFIISTAVGIGVLTLAGYEIAVETACLFVLGMIPVRLVTNCLFRCCTACV